jgi:hypothetical protein
MRYFNIAGPCNRVKHYMIDAASRLHGVEQLIDMEQYFVIHAARQSGKTTYLKDLTERLNAGGNYYALYCSLENMQGITESGEAIPFAAGRQRRRTDYPRTGCRKGTPRPVPDIRGTKVPDRA